MAKRPAPSHINHPEQAPQLCEYLNAHGIPACQFLRNSDGDFLTRDENGRRFYVQRFIEGKVYDLNTAPDWRLTKSAQLLVKIHAAPAEYTSLPAGVGAVIDRTAACVHPAV